jgi:hypothetical protein
VHIINTTGPHHVFISKDFTVTGAAWSGPPVRGGRHHRVGRLTPR